MADNAPPMNMFEWLKLIRDVPMPAPVKNVAAWLNSFGDADGTHIFPGLGRLTLATGLSRDTVVQALTAMRESGLLVRTKRGGGRGSRLSDEYQIGVPDCDSAEQLSKLVTAAYESAKPTRKSKPRDVNESAEPTSKAEQRQQNESDLCTYESDLRTYESAGPTPPTRDLPEDLPEDSNNCGHGAEVEVPQQAAESVENASAASRSRRLAARQLDEARAARNAS